MMTVIRIIQIKNVFNESAEPSWFGSQKKSMKNVYIPEGYMRLKTFSGVS